MRFATLLLAGALCAAAADPAPEEKNVIAAVQKLFDGMAAHDGDAIKAAMTPDALLLLVNNDKLSPAMTREDFAKRISGVTANLLERMWEPKVLIRGRIAMLWAEYDLWAGGKFNHCGIDAFMLVKTDDGWKIFNGESTSETQGCKPSPLGPPK